MNTSQNHRDAIAAPLNRYSILRFSGPDAEAFLQAQLSADFRQLGEDNWIQAAYCSPKGRVLAVMTAWREKSAILTALPGEILDSVCKRLTLYRLRSQLEITVARDRHLFAITDESTIERLAQAPIVGEKQTAGQQTRLRLSTRRLLIVDEAAPESEAPPACDDAWLRACVSDGQPDVFEATQDRFVPQMLNLEKTGAVSFKKGCYPGQEVVARLHYLGKARQRMVVAECAHNAELQPGQALFCDGEQAVGQVVIGAPGSTKALVSLRLDRAQEDICVETDTGREPIRIDLEAERARWLEP